jgi:hypothetical protein
MIPAVSQGLIIIMLFNGPIKTSEINLIRSTVAEWPAEVLLVDGEDKFEVDRAADDWGLSQHKDATGIEIEFKDVSVEAQMEYSATIMEKLMQLPTGRSRVAFNVTASQPPGAPLPEIYVGAPLEKGGLPLSHEEGTLWLELESRADTLAARYKGGDASRIRVGGVPGGPRPGYAPGYPLAEIYAQGLADTVASPYGGYGGPPSPPRTPLPTPTEEEKAKIEQELSEVLNRMFDLKLTAYERRISRLEQELKSLREQLEHRRGNKDLIVTRRLNELTGKEDFLSW